MGCRSVVEHMSSMHKGLGSIPNNINNTEMTPSKDLALCPCAVGLVSLGYLHKDLVSQLFPLVETGLLLRKWPCQGQGHGTCLGREELK